jgi:hypothetical protein
MSNKLFAVVALAMLSTTVACTAPEGEEGDASEGAVSSDHKPNPVPKNEIFERSICDGPDLTNAELGEILSVSGTRRLPLGTYKIGLRERDCTGTECRPWQQPYSVDFESPSLTSNQFESFTFPSLDRVVMGDDTIGEFSAELALQMGGPSNEPPSYRPSLILETKQTGRWQLGAPKTNISVTCANQTAPFYWTGYETRPCTVQADAGNHHTRELSLYIPNTLTGKLTNSCFHYKMSASREGHGSRTETELVFYGAFELPKKP